MIRMKAIYHDPALGSRFFRDTSDVGSGKGTA
jgi:hypothetical protein